MPQIVPNRLIRLKPCLGFIFFVYILALTRAQYRTHVPRLVNDCNS